MLSDDQFQCLIEKISMNDRDRERLIRIETIVQMTLENETKCRMEVSCKVDEAKKSAVKAHERIDSEVKSRYVLTGILVSVAVVFAIAESILKLTGKM